MTERNFRTNSNEGRTRSYRGNNYRRAFDSLITFIVPAIVASVLCGVRAISGCVAGCQQLRQASRWKRWRDLHSWKRIGFRARSGGDTQAGSMQDTPLAPIQLSPQRMQSIGVKVGTVESKVISDEIRSYGNVQANERRFAYVQTRFAGWIRQIYADATGDFIEKGQPLFTIYSPDLVASEREYLLARKSAAALQQSAVSGVADRCRIAD